MKRLTCEMCGSIDIVKQDGLFVCQSCGTKYSIEDARQMMVEGTVEVVGTVKIDSGDNIANLIKLAEYAISTNNQKEVENYSNRILEIDSANYIAWLMKGKAAGSQTSLANNHLGELIESFSKALDNVPEDKAEEVKSEISNHLSALTQTMFSMSCESFEKLPDNSSIEAVLTNANYVKSAIPILEKCNFNHYDSTEDLAVKLNICVCNAWVKKILADFKGETGKVDNYTWDRFIERANGCISILKFAIGLSDQDSELDIQRYDNLIDITQKMVDCYSWDAGSSQKEKPNLVGKTLPALEKQQKIDEIMEYHQKIKDIDPNYIIPKRPVPRKYKGCYIATAVYGSYDCPQVWALRRYRDYSLAETWHGRAFISAYYAISPALVKWFGETAWFKNLWRAPLDLLVKRLIEQGIKDTEYEDKPWH